ncbi:THC0290_0291 family protein [Flavobacterium agrisoli]|uniref:Glutamate dehydrogenase n=1 Tax=Flavobacterium agrisoli TaxID=2793066 RepID=A0A934PMV6_9FLAO|nr:glutamate dehydrogenase [Flavobacterium agrisoli]MBK0369770.1 glutamate dehydrogenase [Flavobacterium agrisoli]
MRNRFVCISASLLLFSPFAKAQSTLAHEIGVIAGPVEFRSDFGERNDASTNFGNMGYSLGFVHFLNFSYNSRRETYFNEHFKVRSEISINKTNLKHHGQWVEGDPNRLGVQQLKAMGGKSTVTNLGSQLEYFPFMKIHDFENTLYSFSPYISAGLQFNFYKSDIYSTLGEMGSPEVTFPKYLVPSDGHPYGFSSETGGIWSFVGGAGTHFKLSEMQDLLFEARFQYFSSDWVDGLNPNKNTFKENKNNDWMVWFTFGYVYYLD